MTNTDKRLEEAMSIIKRHTHYHGGDLLDKHIENVLATSIHQALAEERERVEQEITRVCKYAEDYRNYDMRGVDWHHVIHPNDLPSLTLNTLTDNNKDI